MGSIVCDLIIGLISCLKTQVVVLEVDVEVRQDELLLNFLPDNAVGNE